MAAFDGFAPTDVIFGFSERGFRFRCLRERERGFFITGIARGEREPFFRNRPISDLHSP